MIRIVLLDPHPVVHKGFKAFFKKTPHIAMEKAFTKTEDLLSFLKENEIDIVFSEMELEDENPTLLIEKLNRTYPKLSVVIYTGMPQDIYAVSLLKSGALGFISKKSSDLVLIEAVERLHRFNRFPIATDHRNQINYNLDLSRPRTSFGKLSKREIEVLRLLVKGHRNVEISKELNIHQKTVNTYKSRLMKKLDVENLVNLYQHALHLDLI
ncbi:MAG: response regulator transcription factor [Flavobacteriaceae bacterium]